MGRKHCGKRRKCWLLAFSPFPTVFFKALSVWFHYFFWNKPFPNKPWFWCVWSTSLMKTLWEKKLLVTSNISFSHIVFYPFGELFAFFHQIQNCRLQTLSVWKSLKFVIWERVKTWDCLIKGYRQIVSWYVSGKHVETHKQCDSSQTDKHIYDYQFPF